MTQHTDSITYCFGRHLIDLPKDATLKGGQYQYYWMRIETEKMSLEKFEQAVKDREELLRNSPHKTDKSLLMRAINPGVENSHILIFRESYAVREGYTFEGSRWIRGVRFLFHDEADEGKVDLVIKSMTEALSNLRYRNPNEIPNEPGFCIDNGFIAGEPKGPTYEQAGLYFVFKKQPDITVDIDASTQTDENLKPLLERMKQGTIPTELASAIREIKTLRENKHTVGPIDGEEVAATFSSGHDYRTLQARWETMGKLNSVLEPFVRVEFETGNGESVSQDSMRPSLTDKQAIELFDAIVNSIRLRPTTPGKTSAAEPSPSYDPGAAKRLPLGTKVSSLRACPESGVYECPADTPGVADHRVFVAQGRPMPSATIMIPKRGVASFLGSQETKEVETTWTLVAYSQ